MSTSPSHPVLEVRRPGFGATIQDTGRKGFQKFGAPPGGCMDHHASEWANRLLGNPKGAPLLELFLQGARVKILADAWIAITGGDMDCSLPIWRTHLVKAGQIIDFPKQKSGVWTYLAVAGGFLGETFLGSFSALPRASIGGICRRGDILARRGPSRVELPEGIGGRLTPWAERPDYNLPPVFPIHPGPQWELFSEEAKKEFLERPWVIGNQMDRVGFRLEGDPITPCREELLTEPVLPGTIQIPSSGQPLVTMRDGPTVGSYPKLGVVNPGDLSRLAQCSSGTPVRFKWVSK